MRQLGEVRFVANVVPCCFKSPAEPEFTVRRLAPSIRLKIDLEDHGVVGVSGQQPHPNFRPERASPPGYQGLKAEGPWFDPYLTEVSGLPPGQTRGMSRLW